MNKTIKRIAVLTSGGDAPGMNAAVRAVVRSSVFYKLECFAVYQGYQGLIEGNLEHFTARSVNNIINKGGTILRSARSLEFRTPEGRKKAYKNLLKNQIDALVVIGGDGSFTGAMIFQQEFNFPVIAYQVSGEYSMIRAAIQNGWFDEEKIIFETMMCFKRAGCDAIITYFAPFVAQKLINKTF